ncbi:hypothetical protein FCE95_06195 [Luteimonas gilva]|uniref:FAR-17a/AIG1-like protein n=1 Tax=Luteimonas gilva TaxID=2572684 RepID=A0A4U5JYG5_9GAMM|nr:Pr6Pr family membrane protein [Luteimonas gilva]TKR33858.1 hypothetical protein FCE95_06195 [Luteimonas gilva]
MAAERGWRHWLALSAFCVAAGALVLQYVILMRGASPAIGPALATLRFFSYFTILSNLLVAFATASACVHGGGSPAAFFRRPAVQGGIALYIGVTGLIYFSILRHLWQPQGAQWWADTGLHYASPVLYVAWWVFGLRHSGLRWRTVMAWLGFPAAYLLWVLLRGAWVHEYPYPFIDVGQLGWAATVRNAAGVLVLFLGLGALLVAADRGLAKSGWMDGTRRK